MKIHMTGIEMNDGRIFVSQDSVVKLLFQLAVEVTEAGTDPKKLLVDAAQCVQGMKS